MDEKDKAKSSEENQFKVTISIGDKDKKCSVIKADAVFVKNQEHVFGPASLQECEKWLRENRDCPKEENPEKHPCEEDKNCRDN